MNKSNITSSSFEHHFLGFLVYFSLFRHTVWTSTHSTLPGTNATTLLDLVW
jgi:hypothetical protein